MKRLARLAATGSLLAILASAQPSIHLRNRTIAAARGASRQRVVPGRHQMVQFASYPSADLLEQLSRRGVRVLEYIPDNALMVSGASAAALEGLDVTFVGSLEPADKIAPELAGNSTNSYLAIFHADVTAARARELVEATGFDILEHPDLVSNHLVITGSFDRLAELAARDELAYVMPASVDLVARARVLRCPGPTAAAGSVGEYAQVGAGWPKDAAGTVALKYVLQNLTSKADSNSVRGEIERAFREWTKYANISITEGAAGDAARTIAIKFAAGVHGDGYPFDGPGKVLAHTFYPAPLNPEPLAGDMHMDGDEDWRIGAGVDVFSVALHEAGHALGLAHSTQPGAVMYPYYRLSTGLAADDISGIQSVYGNPAVNSPAPPVTPTPAKPVVPVVPTPPVPVPPVTPPPAPRAPPATPSKDVSAPSLRIVTPGVTILSTTASSITITGTASDNLAVASVKWFTGTGASGMAAGTVSWSATIPLLSGTNVITVRAYDTAGNSGWRSLTVVKP